MSAHPAQISPLPSRMIQDERTLVMLSVQLMHAASLSVVQAAVLGEAWVVEKAKSIPTMKTRPTVVDRRCLNLMGVEEEEVAEETNYHLVHHAVNLNWLDERQCLGVRMRTMTMMMATRLVAQGMIPTAVARQFGWSNFQWLRGKMLDVRWVEMRAIELL